VIAAAAHPSRWAAFNFFPMSPLFRQRARGQALPLAMVLLVAVAAMLFFMFNSGQLVQEKIRLTNTADAVAYSAGVFEARVLNYDAYTNRAMIANEIAIGQAVGLASWAKYISTAADNISMVTDYIPVIGWAISAALEAISYAADYSTYAFAAVVTLHDATLNALSLSQLAVHGPANSIALFNRKSVMDEVARKNDPDAVVDPLPLSDDFATFSQRYSTKDERKRMGQLVQDSRDGFLVGRSWDVVSPLNCMRFVPGSIGAALRKRGSSELIDLTEGWSSMDTVSLHLEIWTSHRWRLPTCEHLEIPIGYGKAYSEDDLDDSAYSYAGSRSTNPEASGYADSTIARGFAPYSLTGGAVPSFYDLSQSVMTGPDRNDPRTSMAIRVSKSREAQRYSGGSSIIQPRGRLDLYKGQHAGAKSSAVARVEVYFERPDGKNPLHGREEYGSLFNPYWQVRLAPVPSAQLKAAQAAQGLLLP